MRLNTYGLLLAAILLAGCAQRGVVVEKRLKPSPFAYSNGMDGIYSFLLRDEQGNVHSQMVTPDVYSRYDIGDYFDDQQPGPGHREGYNEGYSKDSPTSDSKAVKPVTHAAPHKKHTQKTAVAAHHKKHRALRAAVKPREEESEPPRPETPAAPAANVMLRPPAPEPQGLDVHP